MRLLLLVLIGSFDLMAGSFTEVSYSAFEFAGGPPHGVNCTSTLATGANSKALTVGPCSLGNPLPDFARVTAIAEPFRVSVEAYPGLVSDPSTNDYITINTFGRAEFTGSFQVVGGSGAAWLEVETFMERDFPKSFSMGDLNLCLGGCASDLFRVPVAFNSPVNYTIGADLRTNSGGDYLGLAYISFTPLGLFNANGNPLDGQVLWSESPVAAIHQPEPGTIGLLCAGLGLLALRRRRLRNRLP